MKKQNNAQVVFTAAIAGAVAAGAVIAVYEVLKSEKGQAAVAKAKVGVVNTATKAKAGVVSTATKAKAGVVNTATKAKAGVVAAADKAKAVAATTADKIKSKLPGKAAAEACECCCDQSVEAESAESTETAEV